jgi:hypothetical protein
MLPVTNKSKQGCFNKKPLLCGGRGEKAGVSQNEKVNVIIAVFPAMSRKNAIKRESFT